MRTFGRVKWFDAVSGQGYVASEGGAQAALVRAQLEPFGLRSIDEGAALSFELRLEGGRLVVGNIYEIAGRAPPLADGMRGDPPAAPARRGHERVRWLDRSKGFGFVVQDDIAGDVLLHRSVMDVFGRFRRFHGDDGARGGSIQIDGGALTLPGRLGPPLPPPGAQTPGATGGSIVISFPPPTWERAVCRWFSRPKGFGFVRLTASGEDVFVHMHVLRKCGMRELRRSQRVRVYVSDDGRGPMALEIEPGEDGEA